MPRYKPYAKQILLAQVNGRTREGMLLTQVKRALFKELGGEDKLTPSRRLLVERCAMLQLRVSKLDEKMLTSTWTGMDDSTYLAWSNSLSRCLASLGLDPYDQKKKQTDEDPLEALRRHLAKSASEGEAA